MTAANTETVQALYAAFKRRDIATVLDGLAPDATWGQLGREQDLPMSGLRHGPAGAAEFFRVMAGMVEITAFAPQRFLAAEDKVFAWGTWSWVMRNSGVAGENEWLHVFTFRDGKVAAWRGYNDTAQLALAWRAPTTAGQRAAAE
jgi:ketosteroid isomerase-like protein